MITRKSWKDLSPQARAGTVAGGIVQLILLTLALRDLRRRTSAQVRGPKPLWYAVSFVNFFGPLAYFAFGRKPAHSA